ncbi:MAG: arylesterase [Candidatus Tectimicrobiota bacterium]
MVHLISVLGLWYLLSGGPASLVLPSASAQGTPGKTAPRVLFVGNSLTAGYGIDPAQAFPALIQEKITARGWPFQVVNAGVSGDTTAAGLRRIDWLLQRPVDVLVLELGTNDGLRGLSLEAAQQNLQAIIDRTRHKYPHVTIVLAGMQLPRNLGPDYVRRFERLFVELAATNALAFVPSFLQGVGGVPALNLPDGMHPTPAGHQIIATNVWQVLEPLLQRLHDRAGTGLGP